ncbi:MAG: cytochrome C [Bacteroidia bacterium]|nr:cytochrome C [Bacteroidia bacterium]
MSKEISKVFLFVDNEPKPIAELDTPVTFEFDSSKLTDGEHVLKIVSKSPNGREGIKFIKFNVRNGPAITVEGINNDDTIDGILPIMINAYDKGNQHKFLLDGSETPTSIPSWLWITLLSFFAWAIYYLATYFSI